MALIVQLTGTGIEPVTCCAYCPNPLDEDSEYRDSNRDRVCSTCYHDGTAYVESLDYALDIGEGW